MDQICFYIGSRPIHWFGVMLALGFLAGLAHWTWQGRGTHRTADYCSDMFMILVLSGVIGARLAYVIANFRDFAGNPLEILMIQKGGLIFYGGLIGACVGVALFARRRQDNLADLADFVVTALPLGHAFGRIGCFLNGCCYGGLTDHVCGVHYPARSIPWLDQVHAGLITREAPTSLAVHPVQLYETAVNLALFGLLALLYRRRHPRGAIAALYLLLYPAWRFAVEFLRGDPRLRWTAFSIAQWVSLALMLAGALRLLHIQRRARKTPA